MCNVCFKELKGWLKSFTRTEILLFLLEAVLLSIFVGFLIFLILHFIACPKRVVKNEIVVQDTTDHTPTVSVSVPNIETFTEESVESPKTEQTKPKTPATVKPGVKCTWKVSQKTAAYTHYFYPVPKHQYRSTSYKFNDNKTVADINKDFATDITVKEKLPQCILEDIESTTPSNDRDVFSDESDGEDAVDSHKQYTLALVKLKPPRDITFGCILTVVHDYWTVTAASCLEAIEEVDNLDYFVMMEGYGDDYSRNHVVADVQIHTLYQGANRSYDLAALRSEDILTGGKLSVVQLPELLDYFMLTIGERFIVLGYGSYRTVNKGPSSSSLRQAYVHNLPTRQCPIPSDTWSLRTLKPGEPIVHAPCGTASLCAGVLFTRGTPCNYCAGTPLLYGSVLYGIMSDNPQCGVSCEPQVYVNIAVVKEWLYSVFDYK